MLCMTCRARGSTEERESVNHPNIPRARVSGGSVSAACAALPWHEQANEKAALASLSLLAPATPASGHDRSSITTHAITGAARFAQARLREWIGGSSAAAVDLYRPWLRVSARIETFCRSLAVTQKRHQCWQRPRARWSRCSPAMRSWTAPVACEKESCVYLPRSDKTDQPIGHAPKTRYQAVYSSISKASHACCRECAENLSRKA